MTPNAAEYLPTLTYTLHFVIYLQESAYRKQTVYMLIYYINLR